MAVVILGKRGMLGDTDIPKSKSLSHDVPDIP